MNYIRVALLSPPYSELTYKLPGWLPKENLAPGHRLAVPLGKSALRVGVLLGFAETSGLPEGVEIRECVWPLEKRPLLSPEYLQTLFELALRQAVNVGRVLGAVLPVGLKTTKGILRRFGGSDAASIKLAALKDKDKTWLAALGKDWLEGRVELVPSRLELAEIEFVQVCKDPPWALRPTARRQMELMEYLWERGGVTRRRLTDMFGGGVATVVETLRKNGLITLGPRPEDAYASPDTADMADMAGFSGTPDDDHIERKLEALVESLADGPSDISAGEFDPAASEGRLFKLTQEQKEAVRGLEAMLAKGGNSLLYGVTGSGKTAVYLELAARALAAGRNVLLLAPEVALACKLEREARKHLPEAGIFLSHGYQSAGKRERLFRLAAGGKGPYLICGTRSSLFLPLGNIGLIVLDEEHDSSFKQDEGLIYQAKELAWYLAKRDKALLLLGSATPDVRTYYAGLERPEQPDQADRRERADSQGQPGNPGQAVRAVQAEQSGRFTRSGQDAEAETGGNSGRIPVYRLRERLNRGGLPELRFVNIRKLGPRDCVIAPESMRSLKKTVADGKQAVILLNRRGYSPLMYCLDCGLVIKCPHCEVGMTFHKARGRMVCHYCGASDPFPEPCARCGGAHYLAMGEGTEKLEESLLVHLPLGTKILRFDHDTTRRPGRAEEILAAFAREEAQVLVGTQMLSKGHHFPKVTLVIIADADLGLNVPDYQAAERTFQLIMQSAGRAGRGEDPGEVIVQTRDPGHFCWQFVQNGDYDGFFEREIAMRKLRRYPPFIRLGLIRLSYPANWPEGVELVNQLAQTVRTLAKKWNITALGPAPAPLAGLKGQRRFQCLLKSDSWPAIRGLFTELQMSLPVNGKFRISLDIDPGNML